MASAAVAAHLTVYPLTLSDRCLRPRDRYMVPASSQIAALILPFLVGASDPPTALEEEAAGLCRALVKLDGDGVWLLLWKAAPCVLTPSLPSLPSVPLGGLVAKAADMVAAPAAEGASGASPLVTELREFAET